MASKSYTLRHDSREGLAKGSMAGAEWEATVEAEEEEEEVAMSEGWIVDASMGPRRMAASWDLERVRAMISRGWEAINSSVATLPTFFVRY
jgi:hypothetical protein